MLFNDRVTLADFHRGTKNCSYFAVGPLDLAQEKLCALLGELRETTLAEASARGEEAPVRPWQGAASRSGVASPAVHPSHPPPSKPESSETVEREL